MARNCSGIANPLFQAALRNGNTEMQCVAGLLSSSSRIGVGPIDLALARTRLYHSGADDSKPDSISALSAR